MQMRAVSLTIFLGLTLLIAQPVHDVPPLGATNDKASLHFPDSITFHVEIQSDTAITSVTLEYGVEQLTCGTVVAKAFPQYTPGKSVSAEWTWEMKQSGSLPPGATIWWHWDYTNANGLVATTDLKTVTWLDSQHNWQTISGEGINLHWYSGGRSFAQELHDAAAQGLTRLEQDAGLRTGQAIDLYIYATSQDMQEAILYEPGWSGGLAFPEQDIVIIGITPSDMDWGKRAETHELTHVLVGHLTFSCLGDVPTWLNEGLAVYSEGELEAYSQAQLEAAVQDNTLFSVRALSGGFSEIPDKADLSYSESYSIVKFLIETYGQDKISVLLTALRDGMTIEDALTQVYDFNVDGLEDAWRSAIGAEPRVTVLYPTPMPTATLVPTFVPVSAALPATTPTPFAFPTLSTISTPMPSGLTETSLTLTILLALACCCILILLALGLTLYLIVRKRKGK